MVYLGHRPLPANHYLNGGPAIVIHFREPLPPPLPPRTIAPLDGAPTAEQLDEEGAWAEPRRRLKIRRQMAELRDRVRLERELGHKIAPRVLDSRWDNLPVGEPVEPQPSAPVEPQQNLPTEPPTQPPAEAK